MAETSGDTLLVRCKCGNPMRVSKQFVGKPMTCYACGKAFVVGEAVPKPEAAAPTGAGGAGASDGGGGTGDDAGKAMLPSPPAQTPPQVVYVVQPPASPAPPQTIIYTPPMSGPQNITVASPIPNPEETIWEGRAALAYFLPGMVWSGLWAIAWLLLAASASGLVVWVLERTHAFVPNLGDSLRPGLVAAFFIVCAALAGWGLTKRILTYLNTYYIFTSQRLRVRQGIMAREMVQMELFRVKDFSLVETLWGRFTGYAHVRILSTDRLANDLLLLGLPGGLDTMDKIRVAAQLARAQTGATMIHE